MTPPHAEARVSETLVTVRSYELDSLGHTNHAVYFNYLEYARYEALRTGGFPYEAIVGRGWGVFVVRAEIDYLTEARLGDVIRIRTWADSYRRTSVVIAQEMVREEEPDTLVARSRITAVFVDENRRPMRVPQEAREAFGPPAVALPGS